MEAAEVAKRLRAAREVSGMTREQAAVRAGISTTTLQTWETTPPVQVETLATLARIYGCSIDSLIHASKGNDAALSRVKTNGKESK